MKEYVYAAALLTLAVQGVVFRLKAEATNRDVKAEASVQFTKLYWWEQQAPKAGGTTMWAKHVIDESWSQAHALALADLDGDKEDELVAGKCIWAHNGGDPGAGDPPAICYYKWSRSTATFTRHTIAAPGDNIALGRQYNVVDLNGDGRLDLTAPGKLGLWVLFNQGLK